MPTLDQELARRAYAVIAKDGGKSEQWRRLPTMLRTNGLLATVAYLDDKKEGAVLEGLRQALQREEDKRNLMEWLLAIEDTGEMMWLTDRAIRYSVWLKRAWEAGHE